MHGVVSSAKRKRYIESSAVAGYFISFEGVDGVGKSTQVELLEHYLQLYGYEVVCTREPGGTELGAVLRQILLDAKSSDTELNEPISDRAEALLFAADRAQHVDTVIRPALERGAVVISDRYVDSSLAYQAGGRGINDAAVRQLQHIAIDGVLPQRTYVLDMSAQQAHQRLQHSDDRMEAAGDTFFNRTRQAFLELAARDPQRMKVIDASLPIQEVWTSIKQDIDMLLHTGD